MGGVHMVGLAIAMFIALYGWGAGYFGWSDPEHKVQLALVAAVEQLRRLERRGPRDLDFGIKMRGAVLERLELADQFAELLALAEIVEGHRRGTASHADQLRCRARVSREQRLAERLPAGI